MSPETHRSRHGDRRVPGAPRVTEDLRAVRIRVSHDGSAGRSRQGAHMERTAKVAMAVLFGTLVVGCGQGPGVTTEFTDRQIFEGAIFGAGPVADLLPEARAQLRPELYARSAEELGAMAEARSATIDAIERDHPGLLADFARAARSGDPAQVQKVLARAISAMSETAANHTSAKPQNIPIDSAKPQNIPIDRRGQNIPIDSAKPQNIPIDRRGQNIPIDSAKPQNIPIDRRGQNIPIDPANPQNIPIDRRGQNIPVGIGSLPPAWELLNSRLFSEQLSASVAMTFGPRTVER